MDYGYLIMLYIISGLIVAAIIWQLSVATIV